MQNIKKLFSKVFKSSVLAFFGLAMAISLVPMAKVNAQVVMVTGSITASPGTICAGEKSNISWATTDATSITISGIGSGLSAYGDRDVFPTQTTTYTMTLSNSTGGYGQTSATVHVSGNCEQPPTGGNQPTVSISADDTSIADGDDTTVRWTSNNATSCVASGGSNGWAGTRPTSGSFNTGSLNSDKTYSITCTNSFGSASDSDSVTVRVNDNNNNQDDPTVDLRADDTTVNYNDSTTVRWTSEDADSCRGTSGINGWSGSKNRSGSFSTGRLTEDTTFRISCENDSGDDDDSVTIRVVRTQATCQDVSAVNFRGIAPCVYNTVTNTQPAVDIYADSNNIAFNGATTIRWVTANATSCSASSGSIGWAGPKSIGPGSFYTGSLTGSRTYSITCSNASGSATDSTTVTVRGQTVTSAKPAPTSLVLITSTVDRNQPIVPTLDNTNPCPGDEITYTINYQNIGTGAITNLALRIDLPYEVTYMFSNPSNPTISGQTLIFNLGTLRANGQGTVTVRVHVRENVPAGIPLNFPAVLSYTDPSGFPQSVNANVSANVCSEQALLVNPSVVPLGASVFGAGFLPTNVFGWLLLLVLILVLILLAKYLFGSAATPFRKRTTTTTIQ